VHRQVAETLESGATLRVALLAALWNLEAKALIGDANPQVFAVERRKRE